jgi:hypothetical protein
MKKLLFCVFLLAFIASLSFLKRLGSESGTVISKLHIPPHVEHIPAAQYGKYRQAERDIPRPERYILKVDNGYGIREVFVNKSVFDSVSAGDVFKPFG